jgi:hypothetical protein
MVLMQARRMWELLSGTGATFGSAGHTAVVVSARSRLCPPNWIGIVALGDGALVTTPTEPAKQRFLAAVGKTPPEKLVRPDVVRNLLPVTAVLGPASLGYAGRDEFRPVRSDDVEWLPGNHDDIRRLLQSADRTEAGESGIAGITSPAFVLRRDGAVVAASGYSIWMEMTAHICVLTDPRYRNCGLARAVASAAVEHALSAGLLAQWRARPAASRRVAEVLGFMSLGTQLTVRTQP